jgi:hypothetical protein
MTVNWEKVQRALYPMKDYEDLARRLERSLGYPFVREAFNFCLPQLAEYTRLSVGSDPKGRYNDYAARLIDTLQELEAAGVQDLLDLCARSASRDQLRALAEQSGVAAEETASVLKYLVYWFIPGEKYLSGLVRPNPGHTAALQALRGQGIRTNLDLLQRGITAGGRQELAEGCGLPLAAVEDWVHRADLSRLPWASKATIANIMGAGYGSLASLAGADPDRLFADFFRYGASIGKNLKLGNEIENSQRIARIVPVLVQ